MCSVSRPKVQPAPLAPPPPSPITEDEAAMDGRQRERRRASLRQGRQSTILAGGARDDRTAQPTTQTRTVLGA